MQSALKLPAKAHSSSRIEIHGKARSPLLQWFASGVEREMLAHGHRAVGEGEAPDLVLNLTDARRPRPYRRGSQATFVVGVVEVDERPADLLRAAYPVLVRSLSNLLVYLTPHEDGGVQTHFVTLEQGYYTLPTPDGDADAYFADVYRRIAPLAASKLVINNVFEPDMPPALWEGNAQTAALMDAGRRLDRMNLLPAVFPLAEILGERDMNHVHRLFGLGGLSYGNLSAREDERRFWMSARGVDKGRLSDVGRDILLITDYLPERDAMRISASPRVEPRYASVDAIEHWTLYTTHPGIGAIIHVHAWMDGVSSTRVNYPCGTYELAKEVAALAAAAPDPTRAVIGLKNHGLTITGHSLEDIFERIDGKLIPQIPME